MNDSSVAVREFGIFLWSRFLLKLSLPYAAHAVHSSYKIKGEI